MAQSFSFENRGLFLTDYKSNTHLGTRMILEEALSEPFLLRCTLTSDSFDPDDQLGQTITCNWNELAGDKQTEKRQFHGYISHIAYLGENEDNQLAHYEIQVRPWLWLLKFKSSRRVFQQQSLKDILATVFDDAGFSSHYKLGSLPSNTRTYCIQYDETDFDFVHRLLAEEGVHYYFRHTSSGHTLYLHDASNPYDSASVAKVEHKNVRSGSLPLINEWTRHKRFHGTSIAAANYDYANSQLVDSGVKSSKHSIANNHSLSLSHFPVDTITGDFKDLSSTVVNTRLAQMEADYSKVEGRSFIEDWELGTEFELSAHPDSGATGKFVLTRIVHTIEAKEQAAQYDNVFEAHPSDMPSYPKPIPKPVIAGLQTATVVGTETGEPQHDAQGRIKIQFPWDTEAGDSPSCWVRVAQGMAGASLGMQFIPRAGEEVIVSFLNNDPDQPVVTGALYNSTHQPPYAEQNSTKSGIKSQLGSQPNELYFDDKKDNELIYLHAAKDHQLLVENNLTEQITGEYAHTTEKAMTLTGNDNYSLTIKEAITEKAKSTSREADDSISEKAKTITIEADDTLTLKVGSNSIEITTSGIKISASKLEMSASGAASLDGSSVKVSSSANTEVSAGASLKLSANASAEMSGNAGVTLSSNAQFKASGMAGAELSSTAMTKVSGAAMTEISGALVKIN